MEQKRIEHQASSGGLGWTALHEAAAAGHAAMAHLLLQHGASIGAAGNLNFRCWSSFVEV